MLDNFNINVTHFVPAPVPETGGGAPDTGFFSGITSAADFVSNNSTIIAIIISLIVTALAVFLLRRKLFKTKRLAILPSLAIFAFMAGFSYAAYTTINSVEAIKDVVANTTIDITFDSEEETTKTGVATAEVTLSSEELEDATVGYTVYAYLDLDTTTDTGLHSTNGNTISATDTNVSDPEDLPNNTYAIYDIENNTYTAISTDEEHPTKVYSTYQDSTEGSTFNVYYAAKVDNTLPEGNYTYDEMAQQLTYVTKANPITFDMAYAAAGKTKDATSGLYKMQDMTPNICSAVTKGENITTQLIDTRDKEVYWVTKLADDECWMTENLRLGGSSAITLTSSDTNMSASSWTLPASGTANFTDSTGYTTAAMNADYKTTVQPASGHSQTGKIGNYYNYCAATAGTYCPASGSATGDATEDICPKNWRMPTGGSSGEYKSLYTAYSSSSQSFQRALFTPLSGYFYAGSAYYQGSLGYFWSSTRYSGNSMYVLYVNSSDVYTTSRSSRYYGNSMRCVAQ